MALKLRSIEPRPGRLAKSARRLWAIVVRHTMCLDERYLAACQRGGIYGEPEFRVLRMRIQAQACRLIQLER